MTIDDFHLQGDGRKIASNDDLLKHPPGPTVEELEGVFEVLGEEIFLMQRQSGRIIWMSQACKALTHKLGLTSSVDEFPDLKKMIYAAAPASDGLQVHAKWHTTDATWSQYIGERRQSSISVFCRAGDSHNIWVRFTHYSDRDDYFRQYIADHEKLFDTSRSISVGEMATTLAHELNQPLGTLQNIVSGVRSRLEASNQGNEEIFDALHLAQKQGQFASEILSRVRSFAKSRQPVIEQCNVNTLIQNTLNLLDWIFQSEKINISYNAAAADITLHGDSTLLQQVLANLLRNAAESLTQVSADSRSITITAACTQDGVAIDISDTGIGLDKNHEETLFTPFRSEKKHGMGVGLNICRSFIELHEGKFWFTSNESRGCTAHVLIPDRRATPVRTTELAH